MYEARTSAIQGAVIVAESTRTRRLVGRLDHGADLLAQLTEICRRHEVRAGTLRAVGALEEVLLGQWDQQARAARPPRRFTAPLEILTLFGTIAAAEGGPAVSAWVSLSRERDNGIELLGGRLLGGRTFACEFVIEVFDDLSLQRTVEPATGLALWDAPTSMAPGPTALTPPPGVPAATTNISAADPALPATAPSSLPSTRAAAAAPPAMAPSSPPSVRPPEPASPAPTSSSPPRPVTPTFEPPARVTLEPVRPTVPSPFRTPLPPPTASPPAPLKTAPVTTPARVAPTPSGIEPAPRPQSSFAQPAQPSWHDVVAASEARDTADEEDESESPSSAPAEVQVRPGDYIDHPKFGRVQVEKVDGDHEYVSARLRNQRLIRLSLEVLTLIHTGQEEGKNLFRAVAGGG